VTEPGIVVRERRPDDLDATAQALVAVHANDGYPVEGVSDPRGWLQPSTLIRAWVAELDGALVGHVLIAAPTPDDDAPRLWSEQQPNGPHELAVLGRLFVLPTARRRSVAESLVNVAASFADKNRLHLLLDVMEKDRAAIRLYERMGWQCIGEATHRFGRGQRTRAFGYAAPLAPE
jgi:ribosomal protein S18 acetylase RimI-like enzyme